MKFKVWSDLHLEGFKFKYEQQPGDDDTVLFLPGDIGIVGKGDVKLLDFLNEMTLIFKEVVYTHGNHEFYHREYYDTRDIIRFEAANIHNLHILHNDTVVIDNVRILGTPLYTNFGNNPTVMNDAIQHIADFMFIHIEDENGQRRLVPDDWVYQYEKAIIWLKYKLKQPFDGKTVVMTHWGPTNKLTDPKYAGSTLNPYFNNDCEYLMHYYDIDTWIYGHTHGTIDLDYGDDRFNGTRIINNPKGYGQEYLDFEYNKVWEI